MFVVVIFVRMMQVTIVDVIYVIAMLHGSMATSGLMNMIGVAVGIRAAHYFLRNVCWSCTKLSPIIKRLHALQIT